MAPLECVLALLADGVEDGKYPFDLLISVVALLQVRNALDIGEVGAQLAERIRELDPDVISLVLDVVDEALGPLSIITSLKSSLIRLDSTPLPNEKQLCQFKIY